MLTLPIFSSQSSSPSDLPAEGLALDAGERSEMAAFLQDMVRTPSLSTQEHVVARLIEDKLSSTDTGSVRVDGAGNVFATLGDSMGPMLVMDAHMDTVLPAHNGWPHEPYAGDIEDDILYGMGACDAKGAIAAMVFAAGKLARSKASLKGSLVIAFVVQEEPCEGCGLRALVEREGLLPDWVVLGEPTNLGIMRGQRGRVLLNVTVRGRSSHASSPELGANAVTAAARLLFGIELLAADLPIDPVLGPGTVAVTHIESQSASKNAIPDACSFTVDRRLTRGETPTRALAQIEAIVQREGIDAVVEIVTYQANSYTGYELGAQEAFSPWMIEESHPLVQTVSGAVRQVIGQPPHVGEGPFSTDGVFSMGAANIPTIGFGPGDPHHAHTSLDQVRLGDVACAAEVYARIALRLLSESQ